LLLETTEEGDALLGLMDGKFWPPPSIANKCQFL
jgi:hypothetical protein